MKSESKIQQEIVMWFRNVYAQGKTPRPMIFSIPNENQQRLIPTGMMSGASDLVIVLPEKIVFVEVKTPTGKQSPKQMEFERKVSDLGYEYKIIRCVDEIITYLCNQTTSQ
jgi:hypothetical protein